MASKPESSPRQPTTTAVDPRPRQATQRYIGATVLLAALSGLLALDVLYLRPSALSPARKALGLTLVFFGLYTQTILRRSWQYYTTMAQLGCLPPPRYPNDPLGIKYLKEVAGLIKGNALLAGWTRLLGTVGHTFEHRTFPSPSPMLLTDEPANVRAVLTTRFDDWDLPQLRIDALSPMLGHHSIFTTNGASWRHARAVLRPAFVRDMVADLRCLDRHVAKLVATIPRDGAPFDMQLLLSMFTIDAISDFMFGHTTDILGVAPADGLRFGTSFDLCTQRLADRSKLGRLAFLVRDRELDEAIAYMSAFVDKYVAEVKHDLQLLQQQQQQQQQEKGEKEEEAKKTSADSKRYMFLHELLQSGEPDAVIRDHLISIFLAGRDTTASALSYLFHELSARPDVVLAIQREIAGLNLADEAELPSWESLRNMQYLNWSIREALRLNPPVASNAREAVRDTVLPAGGGPDGKAPVFVAKGTTLRYLPWALQRRKDIYGSDAEEFRPERWESLRTT